MESPNAEHGDWDGGNNMKMVGAKVSQSFIDKLIILGSIGGVDYYLKRDTSSAYAIENLVVILQLKISKFNISISNLEGIQTNMVKVSEDIRKSGIAKTLYELLIKHQHVIVCDYTQYDGARALWKSLAKENYYLYLYDEVRDTLTKVDDFNNEKAIWSFTDKSKEYILLVVSNKPLNTTPTH